ncbi:glycosyltransferase family 4 protein [uncultured Paludibaculum sp.]|uniref:glycosyltransferase family 4 protein n=1 Tax=uncultured Paludibaculum sp. TaxID=1765020 RepID=UPI002AAA723C|nr:glycosyltransferase family 4 protein [uncultured Paludibaculum sp.]
MKVRRSQARVTIITGAFLPLPPGPGGAVEKMWCRLAEEFACRGWAVKMVSARDVSDPPLPMDNGVKHSTIPRFRRRGMLVNVVCDLIYSLRAARLAERGEVVITNTLWLPALLAIRGFGREVIVDVQRMPKGQLRVYRRSSFRANTIAVEKAILNELPGRARQITVIPNPIDAKTFTPSVGNPGNGSTTVIYAGRVHPEKGIHLLVHAFQKIRCVHTNWRLVVVGPTESEHGGGGNKYVEELKRLGESNIEFVGAIWDPSLLAKTLRSGSIFCYPSLAERGETFGVAVAEAMACGLIPVVSDLECFRDFIRDGVTGFVFDHRRDDAVDQLAQTLVRAAVQGESGDAMRDAAIRQARELDYGIIAGRFVNWMSMLDQ